VEKLIQIKLFNGDTAAAPEFRQLYNVLWFLIFIWRQFGKEKNKKSTVIKRRLPVFPYVTWPLFPYLIMGTKLFVKTSASGQLKSCNPSTNVSSFTYRFHTQYKYSKKDYATHIPIQSVYRNIADNTLQ